MKYLFTGKNTEQNLKYIKCLCVILYYPHTHRFLALERSVDLMQPELTLGDWELP